MDKITRKTKKKDISGHCTRCGAFRERLHRDHIKPKWAGGVNEESNYQLLCANCHEDKTIIEQRSPEFGAIHSAKLKKVWDDEDYRTKLSIARKKQYEDPDERQKLADAQVKSYQDHPERRQVVSESSKKRYENPEYRKRMSAAIKAGWAGADPKIKEAMIASHKKRFEDPAERKRHGEKIREGRKRNDVLLTEDEKAERSKVKSERTKEWLRVKKAQQAEKLALLSPLERFDLAVKRENEKAEKKRAKLLEKMGRQVLPLLDTPETVN